MASIGVALSTFMQMLDATLCRQTYLDNVFWRCRCLTVALTAIIWFALPPFHGPAAALGRSRMMRRPRGKRRGPP